ncbi:MAG: hypothetical protein DI628_05930 [Blastochloris viridis]|uniref:Uncharacterized protein n=1 Tax=Blastochloris viridis TaxID=1079 RepID=A0A6N4RBL4_BLAVI|nr:MAG: hypothetical protein DI628_05930 [Blastochloris viridis]
MKQRTYNLKLGVFGAAALTIGGLMIALAPEAQTMRDSTNGMNRSTHSADKNDPRYHVAGSPTSTISSSVPVSRSDMPDAMLMREPASTGDTRR